MHHTKITALAIAAMASTVRADNCAQGYAYCSANLLAQGDYDLTIHQALSAAHQSTSQNTIDSALFSCLGDGEILFARLCAGGCVNEPFGSKKNDHC